MTCSNYYNKAFHGMFNLGVRELLGPLIHLVAAALGPSERHHPYREQRRRSPALAHRISRRRYPGPSRHSASCGPSLGSATRTWRGPGAPHDGPSTTRARPTSLINVSSVLGPSDTPSLAMAELIALPSLAMSPMAFSMMASDLRRASL
jgi:hypothetical protein